MAFLDTRLPVEVEKGSRGGASFKTGILTLTSGAEKRNRDWSVMRHSFNVSYGVTNAAYWNTVRDLFLVAGGMADVWRFKDWSDYEIGVDATDTAQSIGTGDGAATTFQIFKRYQVSIYTVDRNIKLPVASTVRVFVDGVEQTLTTHYTVNATTGVITFVSAPGNTLDVAVICEFDVPVRFNLDKFVANWFALTDDMKASLPSIQIVEVLNLE